MLLDGRRQRREQRGRLVLAAIVVAGRLGWVAMLLLGLVLRHGPVPMAAGMRGLLRLVVAHGRRRRSRLHRIDRCAPALPYEHVNEDEQEARRQQTAEGEQATKHNGH